MATDVTLVKAAGVLTATANFSANDTVIIGNKTYKFVAAPSAAYDVDLGADLATSLDNLTAAVNGTGTAGTEYAAGTLPVDGMIATNTDTTMTLTARFGGTWGNSVEYREGTDGGNVYSISTAMASGSGDISGSSGYIKGIMDNSQINSDVFRDLARLTEASD
jgi:hypothetical protein